MDAKPASSKFAPVNQAEAFDNIRYLMGLSHQEDEAETERSNGLIFVIDRTDSTANSQESKR